MSGVFQLLVLLLLIDRSAGRTEPKKPFVITNYGAVGDRKAINTESIQRAIDAAASAGGGAVIVPEGTFVSGAIFLKPDVQLRIERFQELGAGTPSYLRLIC